MGAREREREEGGREFECVGSFERNCRVKQDGKAEVNAV